jgi:hypothetical protein
MLVSANSSREPSFQKSAASYAAIFGIFYVRRNRAQRSCVSYRGTAGRGKMEVSIRFPSSPTRRIFMTITPAHIPAIVALVAGILILIMPRLLNLVVAIYLICIGLIGLGLLKWLHV